MSLSGVATTSLGGAPVPPSEPTALIALTPVTIDALAGNPKAQRLAAVMATVVTLWITEALPMPVTALMGAAACTILSRVARPLAVNRCSC